MTKAREVILLACIACSDYTLVGPEGNVQPSLGIFVSVTHGEELEYLLHGFFRIGTDAAGRPRTLADSSLIVEGVVIAPTSPITGALSYEWGKTLTLTTTGPDTITVRSPILDTAPPLDFTAMIPLPVRADAMRIDHVAGTDLLLNVTPVADTTAGLVRSITFWQLTIQRADSGRSVLDVHGVGTHPSPLRLPWAWLEQLAAIHWWHCFESTRDSARWKPHFA
ncbi:MAG: hypothetical protein WD825_09155 [Gemmatimonadaceae bacterium]